MYRLLRNVMILICLVIVAASVLGGSVVQADGPTAWTDIETNLRIGPGRQFDVITTLGINTPLMVESRSSDSQWVLSHTQDNKLRGWTIVKLLHFASGFRVANLSASSETVNGNDNVSNPAGGVPDEGNVSLPKNLPTGALNAPIIPVLDGATRATMRAIFQNGQSLGNNSRIFVKTGDCLTDHPAFLKQFAYGNYNLGKYKNLQAVIDNFMVSPRPGVNNPFDEDSISSHNGFNSSAVIDPEWAPPSLCHRNESSLDCEYRLNKPAVSIIMFGTADVIVMTPEQFYGFLRDIVNRTMKAGIVPLLSTFPENASLPERSRMINQLVLALAREKHLPVMNLQNALLPLPNHGLDTDGIHLSVPPNNRSGFFDSDGLQYGYTMRNLVTLQALDVVWRGILQ